MEDLRDIKSLDLEEFIRRARSGANFAGRRIGIVDARQWRAHCIERSEEIVRGAAHECRALSGDEDRAVGELIDSARELERLIVELEDRHRKELAGGLVPVSHSPFAR